ncbi:AAA family ATPase [Enterobacter bugandensis]|uniref:AAA family ATPase n=1 Tax=Enterobacter bugandensis TaxID=881260 RepID=UPI001299FD4B|nr:AAA family ATPase [Enterobacter bugandensis]MRE94929.1 AAA family ATPase [Enterobacter bugandensis]
MLGNKLEFEGLTGVGKVYLDLEPEQSVYTFIGANGVGKTKTLEALFQVLFFSNVDVLNSQVHNAYNYGYFKFSRFIDGSFSANIKKQEHYSLWDAKSLFSVNNHNYPIVYLGAQLRGVIKKNSNISPQVMGGLKNRREDYFSSVMSIMDSDFGSLGMEGSIDNWFVTIARSSNPYQKKEDNREVEIKTVIRLLYEIDNRIDPEFLEIGGDDRVSLKIEGEKRELSQLSSGFSSILKLVQAIVSGYGYFTNETQLQNVKGIVLIDEIESHLHLTWQVNIIPLLKKLFPNTTFYITTHSSVVLSQLREGEAYTLYRDQSGTVKTRKITSPNKAALADILKDVFKVDLNQIKLENSSVDEQQDAKNNLLELIRKQENK